MKGYPIFSNGFISLLEYEYKFPLINNCSPIADNLQVLLLGDARCRVMPAAG